MKRRSIFLTTSATLGFIFLYAPMIALVVYSFNKSKLVTVWGGWSLKWYGELFRNEQIIDAALLSFKIAFYQCHCSGGARHYGWVRTESFRSL